MPVKSPPLPKLDVHGAYVRRTNLSGAILKGADLSFADATGALFVGADFEGALLEGTILHGADLSGAINLTESQLQQAVINDETKLPQYIDRTKLVERSDRIGMRAGEARR